MTVLSTQRIHQASEHCDVDDFTFTDKDGAFAKLLGLRSGK
jgi:hypothetical protein